MATTRAENKAKTAEAKADDKITTDDKATQEQANTGSDEQTKAASADSSTDDTATQDIATAEDQSGHTSEDIEDVLDADAPEEELDTEYLPGGEIPVSAPGTEGLPRE